MKKRNILIIFLVVVCIGLAVGLFYISRNKPVTPTTQSTEATTQEDAGPDITLALSEYRVFLNWKADETATGYTVYMDEGNGWQEFGSAKINSFRTKGLKGGTSYQFGIKALHEGEEDTGDEMLYTIRGNTLPDTPQVTVTKSGNMYSLEWKAVNNANEYIVYSMEPDASEWTREGITKETTFTFEKAGVAKLFTAVRAVRYADGEKYVSDYVKTLVADGEKAGKMCSYGDSIATGVGSHSYSYANMFAEEHNFELVNKATTGSQIASGNPKKDHIAENIMKDVTAASAYDYLFIEGGNNDYYFESTLGDVTPDGTTEFDMNTTCGALESAFAHLKQNCPDTKVIFIIIHNAGGRATTPNGLGLTFGDYAAGIRAVCEKYDITVVDCLKDSGFDTSDEAMSNQYTHKFNGVFPTGDGVHPTEEAYRLFYMPLIDKAVVAD